MKCEALAFLISLYMFSAGLRAHAVEQIKEKCAQETIREVGLATINLSRDLKKSHRVGAVLQSKLAKAEVTHPFLLSDFEILNP